MDSCEESDQELKLNNSNKSFNNEKICSSQTYENISNSNN